MNVEVAIARAVGIGEVGRLSEFENGKMDLEGSNAEEAPSKACGEGGGEAWSMRAGEEELGVQLTRERC